MSEVTAVTEQVQHMELAASDSGIEEQTQHERRWAHRRHYGIRTGGLNLLLRHQLFSELLIEPAIAPLPNSPAHFLGLTNVRGNLVPVYSLAAWLDSAGSRTPPHWVTVIDQPQRGAALQVDGKPQAIDARSLEQSATPESVPQVLRTLIDQTYSVGGERWHLVNHEALFLRLANG